MFTSMFLLLNSFLIELPLEDNTNNTVIFVKDYFLRNLICGAANIEVTDNDR